MLDAVGMPDATRRLNTYPHELSGGQNQRVMIAIVLAGKPEVLVADEPTTALDVSIQAQILDLLQGLLCELGMALVLITHDLGVVSDVCERVAVRYGGRIAEEAPAETLFAAPVHPHTQGLLGALPPIEGERRPVTAIPGGVPEPSAMPPGCAFAPRCGAVRMECAKRPPPLTRIHDSNCAACVLARHGLAAA